MTSMSILLFLTSLLKNQSHRSKKIVSPVEKKSVTLRISFPYLWCGTLQDSQKKRRFNELHQNAILPLLNIEKRQTSSCMVSFVYLTLEATGPWGGAMGIGSRSQCVDILWPDIRL